MRKSNFRQITVVDMCDTHPEEHTYTYIAMYTHIYIHEQIFCTTVYNVTDDSSIK